MNPNINRRDFLSRPGKDDEIGRMADPQRINAIGRERRGVPPHMVCPDDLLELFRQGRGQHVRHSSFQPVARRSSFYTPVAAGTFPSCSSF